MIEEIIQNYLREQGLPCSLSMPEKPSGDFCLLQKTGSDYGDGIFTATLAVQSYGGSRYAAARLSHRVVETMLAADRLPTVVRCRLVTDYDFPDTVRRLPRYQAVFTITHS